MGSHNDTWFKGGSEYNSTVTKFLARARDARKKRSTLIEAFGNKMDIEDDEGVEGEMGSSKSGIVKRNKVVVDDAAEKADL